MGMPALHFLTYSAHLRQLLFKSACRKLIHAPILPLTSHTRLNKKSGISHKAIAITGIVRAADWAGQNRSMDAW